MAGSCSSSRFASLEQEEIDGIIDNIETKNTKRQNSTAVKLFRQYLTAKNMPSKFEDLTVDEFDTALRSFYMEMRN